MKYRKLAVAVACVGLTVGMASTGLYAADPSTPPTGTPAAKAKHPEMHRALHSLRKARLVLQTAPHDFAGHRKMAMLSTEEAVEEVLAGLKLENDVPPPPATPPTVPVPKVEDKAEARKQLREARGILQTAEAELKKSAHNFGGHRIKALELAQQAIKEIDEGLVASK